MAGKSLIESGLTKREKVYEQLKQHIVSSDRAPGERLVSSRKLGELLGISIFPIHQALKRLERESYVDNRQVAIISLPVDTGMSWRRRRATFAADRRFHLD